MCTSTSDKIKLLKHMCLATQTVLAYLRHLYRAVRNHTGPAEVFHISQAEYPMKPKITFDTVCSKGISSALPWLPSLLMASQLGCPRGPRTPAHEPLHKMPRAAGQCPASPAPYSHGWHPASHTPPSSASLHLQQHWCASLASWCPRLEKANHFPGLKYTISN